MRGGVWWLVVGVVGFVGWLGAGLPALAQNPSGSPAEQRMLDAIRRDTERLNREADEANRRAAEAQRRGEEARRQADREDAILACRARVTAREAEFSSRADFLRARIACADDPQRFR